jgi:hypothetical protein
MRSGRVQEGSLERSFFAVEETERTTLLRSMTTRESSCHEGDREEQGANSYSRVDRSPRRP